MRANMDSRRLLARPVLARALCMPARMPQNIASVMTSSVTNRPKKLVPKPDSGVWINV